MPTYNSFKFFSFQDTFLQTLVISGICNRHFPRVLSLFLSCYLLQAAHYTARDCQPLSTYKVDISGMFLSPRNS